MRGIRAIGSAENISASSQTTSPLCKRGRACEGAKGDFSVGGDSTGASATSGAVAVQALAPPTVSLNGINNFYFAPATIGINATATAMTGGATIAKVEIFNGATLLATLTDPPYSTQWSNVAAGTYTLAASDSCYSCAPFCFSNSTISLAFALRA